MTPRHHRIGPSEVAAVLGSSKYRTPYDVWLSKVQPKPEEEDAFLDLCKDMEPIVESRYLRSREYSSVQRQVWLDVGNVIAGTTDLIVDRVIVDLKTVFSWVHKRWNNVPPDDYLVQVQCYMHLYYRRTGQQPYGGVIAVLERDTGAYKEYPVVYDKRICEEIFAECARWWEFYVATNTPPPQTTPTEAVDGKQIQADAGLTDAVVEYKAIAKQIKELEDQAEALKSVISASIGDADHVMLGGHLLATYKQQTTTRIDTKSMPEEIKNQYTKTTTFRKLVVK